MRLLFVDDSEQRNPTRPGMGRLVSVGGVIVPEETVGALEKELDAICIDEFDFPPGEVFKWSPRRDQWMHDNLVADRRQEFFLRVLDVAHGHSVAALVVIDDARRDRATGAPTHELDVIAMLLERFDNQFRGAPDSGLVIAAEPSGGRQDELQFLADCRRTLDAGTDYVDFEHIPVNVLTAPFDHARALQLADLVTSCTTALVAGSPDYPPPVFVHVRPMLLSDGIRIGGLGLKIHPDFRYENLYYWLLEDDVFFRRGMGHKLPNETCPYATDPMVE